MNYILAWKIDSQINISRYNPFIHLSIKIHSSLYTFILNQFLTRLLFDILLPFLPKSLEHYK